MFGTTKDKKYDLNDGSLALKNELKHIKENWMIFFVCFFVSRYSIIGELFPCAVIVLCAYIYVKGAHFTVLLVTMAGVFSVKIDWVYPIVLLSIYMFFYMNTKYRQKNIVIVSFYCGIVMFFIKTIALVVEGFVYKGVLLNALEAVFVFSSIAVICELDSVIKRKISMQYNIGDAQMEAVAAIAEDSNIRTKRRINAKIDKKSYIDIKSERYKTGIREMLSNSGVILKYFDVSVLPSGVAVVSTTINSEKSPDKTEKDMIESTKSMCDVKLRCTEKITVSPHCYILKFKSLKKIKIKTYTSKAIKDGNDISGDSYIYAGKDDRYYVVLCDGIGSGIEAYYESKGAVDMLARLLKTDFTEEQVIGTLNSLLMLKFDVERYVTFDMQIIDYATREMRVYKAGAAPTYIITGDTVEKIESKSLPIGILENVDYNTFKRQVKRGDIIIMMTDGIIDSISLDSKKSLERYIDAIKAKDPQVIANSILNYALRGCNHIVDDMTVLVTKIGQ